MRMLVTGARMTAPNVALMLTMVSMAALSGDSEKIAARTKEYEDRFLNPFIAASRAYIDDVIRPHSTRWRIA